MKKAILILSVLASLILTGCDGANIDIDEISRTLKISVRTLSTTSSDGDLIYTSWRLAEDKSAEVSLANDTVTGTIASVTVTPALDSYLRSDTVLATTKDLVPDSVVFAFWHFPSRTDEDRDPLSTEGNIRYDIGNDGESVSLRTDYSVAEIVAVYANDGVLTVTESLPTEYVDDNTTAISFTLSGTATIENPKFKIFDDRGEARTDWCQFYELDENNESVTINTNLTIRKEIAGILEPGDINAWKVIVLYEDAAGEVYVVK
ncbi:MAG: hypothetical protein JXR86_13580 [Spirochaetales bacterium]|nr:hypothetical protein [Spirochaetales bacterium]